MEREVDVLKALSRKKADLEKRVKEAVYPLVREFCEDTGVAVERVEFVRQYLPNERGIKDFKEDCFVNVELDLRM